MKNRSTRFLSGVMSGVLLLSQLLSAMPVMAQGVNDEEGDEYGGIVSENEDNAPSVSNDTVSEPIISYEEDQGYPLYEDVTEDKDLLVAPQYYIDDNGKYPFAFSINDAFISKVILTINGISKEYSEDDYQEGVFFNDGSIYYGGFGKSDIKADFNLQGPGEYKAHIKAWDDDSKQGDFTSNAVLDEDIDIHFVIPEPVSYEQYVSVFDESIVLEVYVPVKWSEERVTNIRVSKNGKTYAGYSILSDFEYDHPRQYGIYDGTAYGWRFEGLEYNYYDLFSSVGTGFSEVMEAGDYDFVLELSDGNSMTFSDNIHITPKAVVQDYDPGYSAFNCSGEYYYVGIQGINIMDSDIEALIVDDKGVVCSSFVEKFFYDGQVIYKLKKTGAALNPSSTDTFYIDLKGDYIDARGGRHRIIRERKAAYGIYADPEIDIYPSQTIWNWKTNRLEYRFNSSVPAGSEIVLNIYSGRNDDWELTDDLILATAKATVEDNRFAYFSLLDKEGNICNLWDIWKENGCFLCGIEAKVIGCGTEAECPLSLIDAYNINKPYRELNLSVMKILDPGFNYCNKKISFYAYGPSGSHNTNELYARIEGIDEQISLAINEEKSKDVFDYFGGEVEAVKNTLTEGVHKIEVFEKINGEEKSLCTGNILVRNKDKLYTNYQITWIYHDHAEIRINGESIIPARDISSADLKRKMEEKGFKLEIFDDSYNIVKDIAYEVRAGETLVLYVTGISDYSKDYYFRISMNGYTPIRIQDGKELYEDKAHGQFGGLQSHFYSNWKVPRGFDIPLPSDKEIYNPFYKFNLSSYEDNLPYIAYFYEEGIPEKLVSSIMIDNSKIENGCYYLTEEDVKNLDVKKIYHCELVAGNKSSNYATGYFTYAVREKQEEDEEDITVESVSINKPDKNTLLVGDTLQLSAIVSPSNASNKAVKWKSSKASVATVNDDGLVTAVAKGNAIITVSTVSGNKTDSFKVTVSEDSEAGEYGELYASWEVKEGLTASVYAKNKNYDNLILVIDGSGNVLQSLGVNHDDVLSKVNKIVLENGITHIGEQCFEGMNGIQSVSLPRSLAEIGNQAFSGCGSLSTITIPEKVSKIGESAFTGTGITEVTIPRYCEDISGAFRDCDRLQRVSFEKGEKALNIQEAFIGSKQLKSITLPERCYNGKYTEKEARSPFDKELTSIAFEVGCTKIPVGICAGVSGLKSIILPESIKEINALAFAECTHLEEIRLPKNVTGIKSNAFYLCNSLVKVYSAKSKNKITIGSGNDPILDAEWVVSTKEDPVTGMITINNSPVSSLKEAFTKMDDATKDYVIVLNSDVIGEKNLTIPKTAKSLTIQGNENTINLVGSKITSNTLLILENVGISARNKKGGIQKLIITAKNGMTVNNGVEYSVASLQIKVAGKLLLNGEQKADVLSCDELLLATDGILQVSAKAKITIKKDLQGKGGSIELLEELSKPIVLNGSVTGDKVILTGAIQQDGAQILKTDMKKISAKQLETLFDVDDITENTVDTQLVYFSNGKACIFGKAIRYKGKDFALWKDLITQINADKKLGETEFEIDLNGNVNVKGAMKMPAKGYEQLTINGNGNSIRFTGNIKLTGNTTISDDTELIRINNKGVKVPGKVVKGKYQYKGPETF